MKCSTDEKKQDENDLISSNLELEGSTHARQKGFLTRRPCANVSRPTVTGCGSACTRPSRMRLNRFCAVCTALGCEMRYKRCACLRASRAINARVALLWPKRSISKAPESAAAYVSGRLPCRGRAPHAVIQILGSQNINAEMLRSQKVLPHTSSLRERMIKQRRHTPSAPDILLPHKKQRKPIVDDTDLPFERDSESTLCSLATRVRTRHCRTPLLEGNEIFIEGQNKMESRHV